MNKSHETAARVQRAATPLKRKVSPTRNAFGGTDHAQDSQHHSDRSRPVQRHRLTEVTLRVSLQNGKQRVDFSLNGNDKCVMVDDKITCQPVSKAPIRVASSESN